MTVDADKLNQAVEKNIITRQQAEQLLEFLQSYPDTGPRFDFTHVLYYFGGLIAIGAMTLFMNLGWTSFGGWGIFFIALAYAGVGLRLSEHFQARGYAIPAGICATFAVAMIPLAIYGFQQAMGWWPDDTDYRDYHRYIKWHWLYLEMGTLAMAAIMAWRYPYPFMIMPIAVTLWYMAMDLTPLLTDGQYDHELYGLVSLYFGLCMILFAFMVDLRSTDKGDYAFWLYLFGVLTFWGGMTIQESDKEISKLIYCCINLLMIGVGVVLVRRVFVVFGGLGVALYLGHLADKVFADSWLFPIALTAIGLGIVYLGILWQKYEQTITLNIRAKLPGQLRDLLDSRQ